jgi:hypothetical protein
MADMTFGAIINFICQNKKKSEASAKNIFFKRYSDPKLAGFLCFEEWFSSSTHARPFHKLFTFPVM